MPVAEKTSKLPPLLEQELKKSEQELSAELEHSQEVIQIFNATMLELEQNLNSYAAKIEQIQFISKPQYMADVDKFVNQIIDFMHDVTIAALNYQVHFLNPFYRMLGHLIRYMGDRLVNVQIEEAEAYVALIQEAQECEMMVEFYQDQIYEFTETCTKEFKFKRTELPSKKDFRERLEKLKKTLVPFAQRAETEVPKQLARIRSIIDKTRMLVHQ